MQAAYTNAMGQTPVDFSEFQGGALGGSVLVPGIYKFSTTVNIATDLTLTGTCNDVYVFQIASVYFACVELFAHLLATYIAVLSHKQQAPISSSQVVSLPAESSGQSRTPYPLAPVPIFKASFLHKQMLL
jgi:hypothetical protein